MNKSQEQLRKQYYEAIAGLTDEEDIKNTLPKPEFTNYFILMNELIEDLEQYIETLQKDLVDLDPEMQEYYYEEISKITMKKDLCLESLKQTELNQQMEDSFSLPTEKNLIFSTTNSGNVYIEKDLKSMSEEYYEDVVSCLKRIKSGTTDGNTSKERKTTNNAKLSGLREEKGFKVRVFYLPLSQDSAYIVMARMKKSDNDLKDREEPIIRNKKISKEFETLKIAVQNPQEKQEIIAKNKEIEQNIFKYLDRNKRG